MTSVNRLFNRGLPYIIFDKTRTQLLLW